MLDDESLEFVEVRKADSEELEIALAGEVLSRVENLLARIVGAYKHSRTPAAIGIPAEAFERFSSALGNFVVEWTTLDHASAGLIEDALVETTNFKAIVFDYVVTRVETGTLPVDALDESFTEATIWAEQLFDVLSAAFNAVERENHYLEEADALTEIEEMLRVALVEQEVAHELDDESVCELARRTFDTFEDAEPGFTHFELDQLDALEVALLQACGPFLPADAMPEEILERCPHFSAAIKEHGREHFATMVANSLIRAGQEEETALDIPERWLH